MKIYQPLVAYNKLFKLFFAGLDVEWLAKKILYIYILRYFDHAKS
jgi:hypothetical protein